MAPLMAMRVGLVGGGAAGGGMLLEMVGSPISSWEFSLRPLPSPSPCLKELERLRRISSAGVTRSELDLFLGESGRERELLLDTPGFIAEME